MAVPRNRHSNARKNSKRAHHAKSATKTFRCSNCGNKCLPHRICLYCGYYKGQLRTAAPKEELAPVAAEEVSKEASNEASTTSSVENKSE